MVKLLCLILAVVAALYAQTAVPVPLGDFTGDGAIHRLASSGSARWIIFITPNTNAAAVRVGDSTITANRGARIEAGGGLMYPEPAAEARTSVPEHRYDLSRIYYRAVAGDRLTVIVLK